MKHKDKLLLPAMLAAALAAGPVLAQSTTTQGGAAGTDSRPSTAQGTTPGTTAGIMHGWPANSVVMFRPRLSQLIGTNVYNDRNESIGEVDDIVLVAPAGIGTTSIPPRTGGGTATTGTTTPGTTTPGTMTPGTTTMGSTGMGSTGTGSMGMTGSATTTPGASGPATMMPGMSGSMMPGMAGSGMQQGPMAVIQVGGFLGMGGRLVMVPLSELQWNAERERIIMPNASKESLQGRPAFTYDSLRRG